MTRYGLVWPLLSLLIWWCGIALEAAILFRALRAGTIPRYPNFYVYAGSLFLTDGLLYLVYVLWPSKYLAWVWYPSFVVLFLGCGILVETFRHVFFRYAGADKIARAASYLVVGAAVCFGAFYHVIIPNAQAAQFLYVRLQRDFLTVQAILLLAMLLIASYYRITLGRNMKALMLGYGQCVALTLAALALRAYIGMGFERAWNMIQQLSYLAALVVYLIGLWSYWPDPNPQGTIRADEDYAALASKTKDMVSATSTHLVRMERS